MEVKVKIDSKVLEKWIAEQGQTLDAALKGIAFQVEGEAKNLAPVDTGALKDSINAQKLSDNHYIVQDGVEYGIFQELGTKRMAAHPFLVPALENVRNQIVDFVKREFGKL